MRGVVFALEAVLALAMAASIVGLSATQNNVVSYAPLYKYQLVQDLLEVGVKSGIYSQEIISWETDALDDGNALKTRYAALLEELGPYCLELETDSGKKLVTSDCSNKRSSVSGTRLFYAGGKNRFFRLKATLYFEN
ncbi:TPA: hypothetical protein HA318_04675 [Candidatus Micrarchaeota archaeon]|nr:MAG: hypothetical protein AUJ65_05945 [Candidatus Micrarchaeota archaeon CG1_02_51_15]HII39267.1 hypothetical protein [Candidatus Micrarchaeota archaeon]